MIFHNNQIGTHRLAIQNAVAAVAVPANSTIVIPKQPALGDVGGTPCISVQFEQGDGTAIGVKSCSVVACSYQSEDSMAVQVRLKPAAGTRAGDPPIWIRVFEPIFLKRNFLIRASRALHPDP